MAPSPLITLTDVGLTFGGDPLFEGISFSAGVGDRMCLVGRNGSGKSTLLKIAAGLILPDSGTRFLQPGAKISYLPQAPDFSGYATLGDYVAADLPEEERFKAEAAMEGLQVVAERETAGASGGERRRAALARLLAGEPDLMLLDEPTNHLDISAIAWLEDELASSRAGYVLISHDRAFLERLTRTTLWMDRGVLRRQERGFADFEAWRDKTWEDEDQARHKMDRFLKAEGRWAVEGISARRKRNQGRLRRLQEMRGERRAQILRKGPAAMALEAGPVSGKKLIEAENISKSFGERVVIRDFSTIIQRGDRVAFAGPNGAGKTTLLKLLTGETKPDEGKVKLGTNIVAAVLDQERKLDPETSLWETLTGDPLLGAKGSNDQIMVRGTPRHVVGYLKEFLFDERQARGPVGALSGGERARLMLASIMARESNLLILDEPTNDLDLETLDLLQELLADYEGSALIVSHDRAFLDAAATSTIWLDGAGGVTEYAGGWTDMLAQGGGIPAAGEAVKPAPKAAPPKAAPAPATAAKKLNYAQSRRLELLPGEMEKLTREIDKLEVFLADPNLYAKDPSALAKASAGLAERRAALEAAEEEWLELETLKEELAKG